jgi:hypothetical protein
MQLIALFRLGFPTAPLLINLATQNNSLTHYTKGTQSHHEGAPTACTHAVSGAISLPSTGFFSPFPHGTGSLSVSREYLALEDGPPMFSQDNTCPDLLFDTSINKTSNTRLSLSMVRLPNLFSYLVNQLCIWAVPISLAATFGISIDFFSSGY